MGLPPEGLASPSLPPTTSHMGQAVRADAASLWTLQKLQLLPLCRATWGHLG